MRQKESRLLRLLLLMAFGSLMLCCSGSKKQDSERPPRPQQDAPASQTAAPATSTPPAAAESPNSSTVSTPQAKPSGPPAVEKHELRINNYSKVTLVATLNGEWLGQWNNTVNVPLQPVFQGRNQLVVELQGKPETTCNIEIIARRGDQDVKLMSLDLMGQTGTHTYTFSAR